MTRQSAPIFELPNMGSNPMPPISPDIAGNHRETSDSQCLIKENGNLFGL